ncbi:hypothetical protein ACVA51_10820 [Pseudomonas luteola]
MNVVLTAEYNAPSKSLSKEVRTEIRKRIYRTPDDRVKLAGLMVEAIRQWHKRNALSFMSGSLEHDSITDQATYAQRVVKQELEVLIKYVKRNHTWLISCEGSSLTHTVFG